MVVGLRTNIRRDQYISEVQYRYFPAQNRSRKDPPLDSMDGPYRDPNIQLLFLLHFHLPMLARQLFLGTVPWWEG